MAENEKLIRNKAVGIRLDPKTLFLAKMAARYLAVNPGFKNQSLSSFAEWAIRYVLRSDVMARIEAEFEANAGHKPTAKKFIPMWGESVWEFDTPDRFFGVASKHEDWLTEEERQIWTLFKMHMELNKRRISARAFREFWNNPAIDTSQLKDWSE